MQSRTVQLPNEGNLKTDKPFFNVHGNPATVLDSHYSNSTNYCEYLQEQNQAKQSEGETARKAF